MSETKAGSEVDDRFLASDSKAERDRLRGRLHEIEVRLVAIDESYGRSFRDRIEAVRRTIDEAEQTLEETSSEQQRRERWASLDAEVHELEARLARQAGA